MRCRLTAEITRSALATGGGAAADAGVVRRFRIGRHRTAAPLARPAATPTRPHVSGGFRGIPTALFHRADRRAARLLPPAGTAGEAFFCCACGEDCFSARRSRSVSRRPTQNPRSRPASSRTHGSILGSTNSASWCGRCFPPGSSLFSRSTISTAAWRAIRKSACGRRRRARRLASCRSGARSNASS